MRQNKPNNRGLLDKARFKLLEKEKKQWLENLSMKRAISLEESLLASSLAWGWHKEFSIDHSLCLQDALRKKA